VLGVGGSPVSLLDEWGGGGGRTGYSAGLVEVLSVCGSPVSLVEVWGGGGGRIGYSASRFLCIALSYSTYSSA
jgi:hypothetical protein